MLDFLNRIKSVIWDEIGEPPWNYYFLQNLDKKEYPRYLARLFQLNTGEKLPLKYDFKNRAWVIDKKRCKTFNQKIQWIKLYSVTDLMRMCTDKVAVRDYVKEKIGEEYLKPVLQIIPAPIEEPRHSEVNDTLMPKNLDQLSDNTDVTTYFDQIQWDKLPNAFVIKCNHGCKWHYIIKNKEEYLKVEKLVGLTKNQITNWLQQDFSFWCGFELQYRNIKPKILIEPLMRDEINTEPIKINVYCFSGMPKIYIKFFDNDKMSIWDENFKPMDNIFNFSEENIRTNIDDYTNQTFDLYNQNKQNVSMKEISRLSTELSKDFSFVRVDWMIYQNKLYFEELTFTPYSGISKLSSKNNLKLGNLINLERK